MSVYYEGTPRLCELVLREMAGRRLLSIMYRAKSSRSFGTTLFRRPVNKKLILLVMVPLLILAVRYRIQNSASVPQSLQWSSSPKVAEPALPALPALPVQPIPEKSRLDKLLEEGKKGCIQQLLRGTGTHYFAEQLSEKTRYDNTPLAEMLEDGWTEVENDHDDAISHPSGDIYIHPHNGREDVTVVAATAGPEDTSWIDEFCENEL